GTFLNDPYYFPVDNFFWLLTLWPASFRVPIRPCPLSALKWGMASRGESVEVPRVDAAAAQSAAAPSLSKVRSENVAGVDRATGSRAGQACVLMHGMPS